jgi:hypothetical protein
LSELHGNRSLSDEAGAEVWVEVAEVLRYQPGVAVRKYQWRNYGDDWGGVEDATGGCVEAFVIDDALAGAAALNAVDLEGHGLAELEAVAGDLDLPIEADWIAVGWKSRKARLIDGVDGAVERTRGLLISNCQGYNGQAKQLRQGNPEELSRTFE